MVSKKIKVLNLIKSLGRGGAEMLLPETLKHHDKNQFEFHYIYFLPWKNQMVEEIQKNGGKVTCIAANNNIQLIARVNAIIAYIRKHDIQLVHAHLPWAGIAARIVGRIAKVPIIYTEHNKQERYHFLTRWLNLGTMNWLKRVVVVSKDVESSVRKYKSSLRPQLQVILNGVDTDHFAPGIVLQKNIRDELNISRDAQVIGTVAVFRFQKRLEVWMEVAASISLEFPNVHFVIVGDGPLKSSLLEKRANLKMEGKIHFAGLQTDIRPYLAAFDLYMMSSIFEGLPIALLEAMAFGCPVITTDAGGIKEVVQHNKTGLLCPVDEPQKLVDYARELLTSKEKREMLATNGRKLMEEKFSIQSMVYALEDIYKEEVKEI